MEKLLSKSHKSMNSFDTKSMPITDEMREKIKRAGIRSTKRLEHLKNIGSVPSNISYGRQKVKTK